MNPLVLIQLFGFAQSAIQALSVLSHPQSTVADKMQLVQAVVQAGHNVVTSTGGTTSGFDEYWTPLSAMVSAMVQAQHQTAPVEFPAGV